MENHPIPQDVTGFQFKLIGTMTVKQFGYVASGVVLTVIFYYLPIHSVFGVLLKILLIPLFGSSGVIIAFVPIGGRPIDVMATNLVKAILSPNQYIYHRQGQRFSFTTVTLAKVPTAGKVQQKTQTNISIRATQLNQKEEKLRALLLNSGGRIKNDIDKKEAAFLQTLTLPMESARAIPQPTQTHMQSTSIASPLPIHPAQQTSPIKLPVLPQVAASRPLSFVPQNNPEDSSKKESQSGHIQEAQSINKTSINVTAQQNADALSKQIQEIHSQKQKLEQELSHLQNQLESEKSPVGPVAKPTNPQQPIQDPQHVRVIPQNVTKKAGLPHVSDSPNVVVGIVKDPRGNILSNILVEVKDKEGNPVRAFKTNQLGQFASATPLSNGTYTIALEDPKNQQRFDVVQITANNQILLPIEIISHDAREDLRKQLFAN